MPFENEIVIVELSGENMLDLIEYIKTKSAYDKIEKGWRACQWIKNDN